MDIARWVIVYFVFAVFVTFAWVSDKHYLQFKITYWVVVLYPILCLCLCVTSPIWIPIVLYKQLAEDKKL